jgi:hypothetical protein
VLVSSLSVCFLRYVVGTVSVYIFSAQEDAELCVCMPAVYVSFSSLLSFLSPSFCGFLLEEEDLRGGTSEETLSSVSFQYSLSFSPSQRLSANSVSVEQGVNVAKLLISGLQAPHLKQHLK